MKRIFLLGLLSVIATTAQAQKKLTPVTKSALTVIGLPNGSKQDSRILSVAAAATLLEMEINKTDTKIQNTEVLILPPASLNKFNKDSLIKRITAQSWKITSADDRNYLWLQKDKRIVIAYFGMNTKQTDLYLAEVISSPVVTSQGNNTTSNQSTTQTIVQPATLPVNQATTQNVNQPTQNKADNTSVNSPITGIWRRGKSVTQYGGRWSYIAYQYTFNSNGTYTYIIKTYVEGDPETLLTRESGSYIVSEKTVTLNPKTNVIEAWSKSNGGDNYKALISSQNKPLEKITYQFTIHFFPELKENDLVLIYGNETVRDGKYNATEAFPTGWRFSPSGPDYKPIPLPGEQPITTPEIKKDPIQQNAPATNGKFAFSTTNFDDGWVSTVQEDWVQVTKGNVNVLIHYPNKSADAYNSVLMDGLKNAWNILVAPKYSTASNFEFKPITSWQSIEFAEADAVEKTTGKSVHVVLFKMNYSNGSGKYLEFITPDKKTFEQEFGPYHETSYGWEKVENMAMYNKFAVSAADLNGTWTTNFTGMTQYVNAYTGADAGASTHASSQSFIFSGDTYHWEIGVASGMVGNIKFQSAKSDGKFSMVSNWQVKFSDMEGKPKTYDVYFSCIKGARMLWLSDTSYPGYTGFGKKE
jgi:hypothetical protein